MTVCNQLLLMLPFPPLSRYGCSEEILTITAMLSVNNAIFYRPKVLYTRQVLGVGCRVLFERFHLFSQLCASAYTYHACVHCSVGSIIHVAVNVEIEGYSVMYFDCIAVFEAPYH